MKNKGLKTLIEYHITGKMRNFRDFGESLTDVAYDCETDTLHFISTTREVRDNIYRMSYQRSWNTSFRWAWARSDGDRIRNTKSIHSFTSKY